MREGGGQVGLPSPTMPHEVPRASHLVGVLLVTSLGPALERLSQL